MAKKPRPSVNQYVPGDKNIAIAGNENTVNQTIVQKFFNIFKSDAEAVDQRNRRIMLGHVENFWVKGILEKSLHSAALLELGIKKDPNALSYPWAIKREATKGTLPAGMSMQDIFQEIGMGRSLLILGAPGSGKTTSLLELARQLIERARKDVIEPIPVVFSLSSWTEKFTLAEWLARELNIIYTIPNKVATTWVKENSMLLLLDGLDEVRQESRDKCVDAINQFRKENGLTSMAVCSRIQDYADLKTRLSFEGAIEIQPLTADQVNDYFNRFSKGLAGIRQVLEKDTILREIAETPLFLSIMTLAYSDTDIANILVSENVNEQYQYLFDTYIEHMFSRPERSKSERFKKQDVMRWLSWLARNMSTHNQASYFIENMQPKWLGDDMDSPYRLIVGLAVGLIVGLISWGISSFFYEPIGLVIRVFSGPIVGIIVTLSGRVAMIEMVYALTWEWAPGKRGLKWGLIGVISDVLFFSLTSAVVIGCWVAIHMLEYWNGSLSLFKDGFIIGLVIGLIYVFVKQGFAVIQHYAVRVIVAFKNILPWRLIPFLNHCTDLIFLRRVGGGYIFVHRLLMEHFAAMYSEGEEPR